MLTTPGRSGLEEDFPSSLTHCLGLLHLQRFKVSPIASIYIVTTSLLDCMYWSLQCEIRRVNVEALRFQCVLALLSMDIFIIHLLLDLSNALQPQ